LEVLRAFFSVVSKGLLYTNALGLETLGFETLLGTLLRALKVLVAIFILGLLFTVSTNLTLLFEAFTFLSYFAEEDVLKFLILCSKIGSYLILGRLLLLTLVSLLIF
jgi:hypothetical protein